ncbi:MAG: DUF4872 domain-containing protein [Gilvibacter sp.]
MNLTQKYKENYMPGFDCRMTTYRNNLAVYDCALSNGMVLGLSGCLSLVYGHPEKSRIPFYTLVGITDQTLEGLASVFDTYLIRGEMELDDAQILEKIKDNLQKGVVVNAAINRPFLNHLRAGNTAEDFTIHPTNIGFHYVSITAVEDGKITFFETDYSEPLTYDFEVFKELWFYDQIHGRATMDPHQKCNGKYYTIFKPGIQAQHSKPTLMYCINKVVKSFYAVKNDYDHGLTGLEDFFDQMQQWHQNPDKHQLISSVYFLKILERNLSGGGFGRRLYSSFLAEVAQLFNDKTLQDIAIDFRETSKLWASCIKALGSPLTIKGIAQSDPDTLQQIITDYKTKIIHAEKQQFERLGAWIETQ